MNNGPADSTPGANVRRAAGPAVLPDQESRSMMTLYSRGDDAAATACASCSPRKPSRYGSWRPIPARPPEDLIDLNPYQTVPTLVDRELVVYEPGIICEYLDERFPHPPLTPLDPGARAQARVALNRIEQDWYARAPTFSKACRRGPARTRRSRKFADRERAGRRAAVQSAALVSLRPVFATRCGRRADPLAAAALGDRLGPIGTAVRKSSATAARVCHGPHFGIA